MNTFEWAFTVLMHHEGVDSDHPADPGGKTRYGVSLRFLRNNGIDIDGDGDVDAQDVAAVTYEKARDITREWFWKPARCHEIKSSLLAVKILDMAYNMGQVAAYRIVQRAINTLQSTEQLKVDGIVGPATLKVLNNFHRRDFELLESIRRKQMDFYDGLMRDKPSLEAFRLGWSRRAVS